MSLQRKAKRQQKKKNKRLQMQKKKAASFKRESFEMYAPIMGEELPNGGWRELRNTFKRYGIKTTELDRIHETMCKWFKKRLFLMPNGHLDWQTIRSDMERQICEAHTIYAAAMKMHLKYSGFQSYEEMLDQLPDDPVAQQCNTETFPSMMMLGSAEQLVNWSIERWPLNVVTESFFNAMRQTDIPDEVMCDDMRAPYPGLLVSLPKDLLSYNDLVDKSMSQKDAVTIPFIVLSFDELSEEQMHIHASFFSSGGMCLPMVLKCISGMSVQDMIEEHVEKFELREMIEFIVSLTLFLITTQNESNHNGRRAEEDEKDETMIDRKKEVVEIWHPKVLGEELDVPSYDEATLQLKPRGPVRPHWRRGHFKRAYPTNKIVWIRPVLVNKKYL